MVRLTTPFWITTGCWTLTLLGEMGTLGAGQTERPKYPEKTLPDNNP